MELVGIEVELGVPASAVNKNVYLVNSLSDICSFKIFL